MTKVVDWDMVWNILDLSDDFLPEFIWFSEQFREPYDFGDGRWGVHAQFSKGYTYQGQVFGDGLSGDRLREIINKLKLDNVILCNWMHSFMEGMMWSIELKTGWISATKGQYQDVLLKEV
jgi:hypothetical protein